MIVKSRAGLSTTVRAFVTEQKEETVSPAPSKKDCSQSISPDAKTLFLQNKSNVLPSQTHECEERTSSTPTRDLSGLEQSNLVPDLFDLSKISFERSKYQMSSPNLSRPRAYTKTISHRLALRILESFRQASLAPEQETIRGFTLLMQGGGTNKSKRELVVTVGRYNFDLNLLRKVVRTYLNRPLVTVRQLARALNCEILKIAVAEEIQGPLVYELQRMEGGDQIKTKDYPYCNEIFVNNPDTPQHVRQLIKRREKKLQ